MDTQPIALNLVPIGTETTDPQMYRLVHPYAITLRDLFMHRRDLEQTSHWLEVLQGQFLRGIQTMPTANDEAFWTASIVAFFRCFTPSARGHLDAKKVFKNEPHGAIQAYQRLYAFRNRTIVHDESFFNQGFIGVPVSNPEGPVARVGPIQIFSLRGISFDFEEISNLFNLANAAIRWIDAESTMLNEALANEIKKMSRLEIIKHGTVEWTSPSFDSADTKRPRI